jgi:hypothetical protein
MSPRLPESPWRSASLRPNVCLQEMLKPHVAERAILRGGGTTIQNELGNTMHVSCITRAIVRVCVQNSWAIHATADEEGRQAVGYYDSASL